MQAKNVVVVLCGANIGTDALASVLTGEFNTANDGLSKVKSMTEILERKRIEVLLASVDLVPLIEEGFVAYSQGNSVVPPVGELQLEQGEVHIKYGYIKNQSNYVIKIASGFYGNFELGLPTGNGCMLVFCQSTGQLKGVLLDEGHLTDVRTAVAGAIAAKYLAPEDTAKIGIVGTGIQAHLQLLYLQSVVRCREVLIWGRSSESLQRIVDRLNKSSSNPKFNVETTTDLDEIPKQCNLIITTTPSKTPLIRAEHVQPGTQITAVGSDTPDKQELDSEILAQADVVVADSIEQCKIRGEIARALQSNLLTEDRIVELGNVISGASQGRTSPDQITVVDLTGVAIQDIQIGTAVLERH